MKGMGNAPTTQTLTINAGFSDLMACGDNSPCAAVDFVDFTHESELIKLIHALLEAHHGG
jgi:hypothetical protein